MPQSGSGEARRCSFCGKREGEVVKLIAGPGVYICDQCIDLCNEIIAEEIGERPPRVLDMDIQAAARAAQQALDRLRDLAQQARAVPATTGDPD